MEDTHRKWADEETERRVETLNRRMQIGFACLSALGGTLMGMGGEGTGWATIAIFFAVFGFVCVDWLRLFSLPPILAYFIMGLAGIYCVSDFTDFDTPGGQQIDAVAELLVVVQAVMMLQTKSRRVYEQIVIFCMLQLVVAAVFNDALRYGLMLIPIGFVGGWGLSLLSATSAADLDETTSTQPNESSKPLTDTSPDGRGGSVRTRQSGIQTWSPRSRASFVRASKRVSGVSALTIAPAIIAVGVLFFFLLPRTGDAARTGRAGKTLVGFSDRVSLKQFGQLLQNNDQALRITLTDRSNRKPYLIAEPIYLRGVVLEKYGFNNARLDTAAEWTTIPAGGLSKTRRLPHRTDLDDPLSDSGEVDAFDAVEMEIACESMEQRSLFAVAPYFATESDSTVVHDPIHWTLQRHHRVTRRFTSTLPRINYRIGTHAFRGGFQTELIAPWTAGDPWGATHPADGPLAPGQESIAQRERRFRAEAAYEKYLQSCLEFPQGQIPTAAVLARQVYLGLPAERRGKFDLARALTRYLNSGQNGFRYSLRLDADSIPGMDPIQQFLSQDRTGHCQFYASALCMMLRSQRIPARLVVGFCTDEYSRIGGHYLARQSHAHAWVEALIPAEEIPGNVVVGGQRPSKEYWMRLDPTPGGGGGGQIDNQAGGVEQVMDIAQNLWKDYVVDMDAERQEQTLLSGPQDPSMQSAYSRMIRGVQAMLLKLKKGDLGRQAIGDAGRFSWSAAMAAAMTLVAVVVLLRIRLSGRFAWWSQQDSDSRATMRPSLPFYANALEQLGRLGLARTPAQTPEHLAWQAEQQVGGSVDSPSEPFRQLTKQFYDARYRGDDVDERMNETLLSELTERIDRVRNESCYTDGRPRRGQQSESF